MQLPALSSEQLPADSDVVPEVIGYASYWTWTDIHVFLKKEDHIITTFSVLIVVATKLSLFGFCYEILQQIRKYKINRKTHGCYYNYWGAQVLIVCTLAAVIYFELTKQRNKTALYVFLSSFGFDVLTFIMIAVIVTKSLIACLKCIGNTIVDCCGCCGLFAFCCYNNNDSDGHNISLSEASTGEETLLIINEKDDERTETVDRQSGKSYSSNSSERDIGMLEYNIEVTLEHSDCDSGREVKLESPENDSRHTTIRGKVRQPTSREGPSSLSVNIGTSLQQSAEDLKQQKQTSSVSSISVPPPLTLLFHCCPFCCCIRWWKKIKVYWIGCFPILNFTASSGSTQTGPCSASSTTPKLDKCPTDPTKSTSARLPQIYLNQRHTINLPIAKSQQFQFHQIQELQFHQTPANLCPQPVAGQDPPSPPTGPVDQLSPPTGPVEPTNSPTGPVEPKNSPTGPVEPTNSPTGPVPVEPINSPTGPVPVDPTNSPTGPVEPTNSPTRSENTPTGPVPVDPTNSPTRPVEPTNSPTGPENTPSQACCKFFCMCCWLAGCCFCKCECCSCWWCSACGIPCCTLLSSKNLEASKEKPWRNNTCIKALKCCVDSREKCTNCMNEEPWKKCGDYWKKGWIWFTNITSLITFLAFVSYLSQAFPAIVISYYLSPTASLIRLGFFEVIIVIMILEVSYLLFLLDKCAWLCYYHKHKKIPEEIETDDQNKTNESEDEESNEHKTFISQYIDEDKKELIYSDICQCNNCYYPPKCKRKIECYKEIKHCHCALFTLSCIQIFTMLFIIILSAILLFFLLNVVIQQTSDSDTQFKDILAIVPTIAVNLFLLSVRQGNVGNAASRIANKANYRELNFHRDPYSAAENGHAGQHQLDLSDHDSTDS